jgi:hypothetical protein
VTGVTVSIVLGGAMTLVAVAVVAGGTRVIREYAPPPHPAHA